MIATKKVGKRTRIASRGCRWDSNVVPRAAIRHEQPVSLSPKPLPSVVCHQVDFFRSTGSLPILAAKTSQLRCRFLLPHEPVSSTLAPRRSVPESPKYTHLNWSLGGDGLPNPEGSGRGDPDALIPSSIRAGGFDPRFDVPRGVCKATRGSLANRRLLFSR